MVVVSIDSDSHATTRSNAGDDAFPPKMCFHLGIPSTPVFLSLYGSTHGYISQSHALPFQENHARAASAARPRRRASERASAASLSSHPKHMGFVAVNFLLF